jgi:hypothetical protein
MQRRRVVGVQQWYESARCRDTDLQKCKCVTAGPIDPKAQGRRGATAGGARECNV